MDPNGAVVPNAEVIARNGDTGTEFKTKSNDDGSYVIPSLPVGVYTVTVKAQGFKQTAVTGVKTEIGGVSTLSFLLTVCGSISLAFSLVADKLY